MSTNQPPTRDEMWRQYALLVDLYKHYLELVLKFNVFFYAVTGAIVSFYLSRPSTGLLRHSLLFPCLMNLLFACFFVYGSLLVKVSRDDLFTIVRALGFHSGPELRVLTILLRL